MGIETGARSWGIHVDTRWAGPIANSQLRAREAPSSRSLGDRFWSSVNHLATKPVQFYFRHGSNNVTPTATDMSLGRFGDAEVKEILSRARPGDIILFGDKTSFVHGSVYVGNGEIVHALAARGPQGKNTGVVREKLADYLTRVERHRAQVLRPAHATPADVAAIVGYATRQVGKDYDFLFRTGKDDAFYCTELAWSAILQGAHPPRVETHRGMMGLKKLVTTDDIRRSPDLQEVWGKNVPRLGNKPAVGLS